MQYLDVASTATSLKSESAENDILSNRVEEERFVISACNINIRERARTLEDVYKAMVDLGANVNLGPVRLAKALGLQIVPHKDGRKIGTADEDGKMEIVGWIYPNGYTGPIAIVKKAAYVLLSVIQMQKHGMGVNCSPERPICTLTILQKNIEIVFIELVQSPPTNLYFIDIRKLIANYQPEYVVQSGDFTGPGTVLGGCAGTIEITDNALEKCVNLTHGPNALSKEIKKEHHACRERRKPSVDVLFRVWALHKRTNHASLSKLAFMERMGKLKHADCTEAEILLVSQHQDCVSCMLAKARAISAIPSSGIRYATPAIGGYTGRFLFVERSRGYVISFLVKAKTEAFECVSHVHQHCRRFGHTMMELQTDMGSVENSVLFRESCHKLNNDRQERGVEVNPVNINMQKQNVVERYIQTD